MKLSMSTSGLSNLIYQDYSDRQILEVAKKSGFSAVDYDLTGPDFQQPEEMGKKLRESLAELEMTAPQAHAVGLNPAEGPEKWKEMRRCFLFCQEAGIPAIVVHPGAVVGNTRKEFFESNLAFFRGLLPYVEETGVGLLLENIGNPADPYFLLSGSDLREMVDGVDHPLCTACWDIGHANHFPAETYSQYDSILALGDKLTAIHFHDNAGNFADNDRHIRVDMHMVPFMSWVGSVNYDAVLTALTDVGYKGTFNLELSACNPRRFVTPFRKDGRLIDRLSQVPEEVVIKIYSCAYEIGKYMLETYQAFEE